MGLMSLFICIFVLLVGLVVLFFDFYFMIEAIQKGIQWKDPICFLFAFFFFIAGVWLAISEVSLLINLLEVM